MVQEDLLLPGVFVLWHGWRRPLWWLRHNLRLWWCPRWWWWYNLDSWLRGLLLHRLHIEDGLCEVCKLSWPNDVVLCKLLDHGLHLRVVFRQGSILKPIQLDAQHFQVVENIPLFLCSLGFLPIAVPSTYSLHALQQWVVMSFLAKSAPHRALVASVVAMAIPTDPLSERTLLVFVVVGVAVQAQHALHERITELCTRKPKRPIVLCWFRIRETLLLGALFSVFLVA
mmetsp:Transcript_37715/g.87109  ORF Transcript_37715/g.87109 Transcript_37715/m.87109 type:complete len:227 (-) Transcript_37715:2500-3180(-)